jgi:hypothetical protein
MARLSDISTVGTAFHGVTITSSIEELELVLGKRNELNKETGKDWRCETEMGDVFTIYAWDVIGEPRHDEKVVFHIGAHSSYASRCAVDEIIELINNRVK